MLWSKPSAIIAAPTGPSALFEMLPSAEKMGWVQKVGKPRSGALNAEGKQLGCGALEGLKLAQRQRLGKLERSGRVLAPVREIIPRDAVCGCRKSSSVHPATTQA